MGTEDPAVLGGYAIGELPIVQGCATTYDRFSGSLLPASCVARKLSATSDFASPVFGAAAAYYPSSTCTSKLCTSFLLAYWWLFAVDVVSLEPNL